MKMERSFRNARLMQQRFQRETKNGNRLWFRALEIRESVAQLFTAFSELHFIGVRSRVLEFADDEVHTFLAYRVTRREVEGEE